MSSSSVGKACSAAIGSCFQASEELRKKIEGARLDWYACVWACMCVCTCVLVHECVCLCMCVLCVWGCLWGVFVGVGVHVVATLLSHETVLN